MQNKFFAALIGCTFGLLTGNALSALDDSQLRSILIGQDANSAHFLEFAQDLENGADGLGKSPCLSNYFYQRVLESSDGASIQRQAAQAGYERVGGRGGACSFILHRDNPTANLADIVEFPGRPGVSSAIFANFDKISHSATGGRIISGNNSSGPTHTGSTNSAPAATTTQPLITANGPGIAPVSGQASMENLLAPIVTGAPDGLSARFDPTPLSLAMTSGGGSPFVQADSEAQCGTHNSMFWAWQKRMAQYGMLSYLVYFNDADVRKLTTERDELSNRRASSDALAARTPLMSKIEQIGIDRRLKEAEQKLAEVLDHVRTMKTPFLASRNLVLRDDLLQGFLRTSHLTQERLDKMSFRAEIYSQGDETIIVFRGTTDLNGWKTNGAQIASILSVVDNGDSSGDGAAGQYEIADKLVHYVIASGVPREHIYVTGHSLGGGLASYSHLRNNTAGALVFNPAQLGVDTRARVAELPHFGSAKQRIANYISYLQGTSVADPVSQGTDLLKDILAGAHISVASIGKLFGGTYYLPIDIKPMPVGWSAAGMKSGALTVAGLSPGYKDKITEQAAKGAINVATLNRKNHDILAEDSVGYIGTGKTMIEGVSKFEKHPFWMSLRAAAGGAIGHVVAGFGWRELQLHTMEPLSQSIVSQVIRRNSLTCASEPTPEFVKEQLEHKNILSKLALLK